MDVLSLFVFLVVSLPGGGYEPPVVVDILFDQANPHLSVALMKDAVLEEGDYYQNCRIVSFEPEAIVARENETEDTIKWLKTEGAKPRKGLRKKARYLFTVKQMKTILDAQVLYVKQFGNGFSPDLETLLEQGFLPDGFEDWSKEDYRYEMANSGYKQKLAADQKPQPYFFAVASPARKSDPFFSIDELGTIRFSTSRSQLSWAPVWDYADRSGGPAQKKIR